MNAAEITAETYDASYYGAPGTVAKANYHDYGPNARPSWSYPLAKMVRAMVTGPYLDLGCAFGHLVRDLNRIALTAGGRPDAYGVEWSPYATEHSVDPAHVRRQDVRDYLVEAEPEQFGAVVSLDFLEHFVLEDTLRLIAGIWRLTRPGGVSVHLIGAHNPADDLSRHMADPTHQNHESLGWYENAFRAQGFEVDEPGAVALGRHPAWAATDWNGRFLAAIRPI